MIEQRPSLFCKASTTFWEKKKKMGLSCVSAVLGAGRDALSALTVASASGPQVNVSLGVYKQQATEGASSFYGEFPKEEEQSLPQREFTVVHKTNVTWLIGVISDVNAGR